MKIYLIILLQLMALISLGQVSEGLIAKYSFNNGNANDEQGSVNGITNKVTLTTDRFGCADHAFEFNGNDTSFITLEDNFDNIIALPDSSFSFSLWFKRNDTINFTRPVLLAKYGNSACGEDQREFIILLENHKVQLLYFNTLYFSDVRGVIGSTLLNDTNWHHLVFNYYGNINTNNGLDRVEFYLDNIPDETTLILTEGNLGDIQNGSAHFSIGPQLSSNGNYCSGGTDNLYDGKLDDLQLFNKSLTPAEVNLLYLDPNPCHPTAIDHWNSPESSIRLYPIPASSFVKIESNRPVVSLDIIDHKGDIIKSYQDTEIKTIDLTFYSEGVYFIYGKFNNHVHFVRKLLIQK